MGHKKVPNEHGEWYCAGCKTWKLEKQFYFDKAHNRPHSYCKGCRKYGRPTKNETHRS